MRLRELLITCLLPASFVASAQCDRWQQRIRCAVEVDLDHLTHQFSGTERLTYFNNSPDTLHVLFFHLYFNAFKPGSEMDVRSRTIVDPDRRIGARIAALTPSEMGELRVTRMVQGGTDLRLTPLGTVLKAELAGGLVPGDSAQIEMDFSGQVPVQVRRSGRDNKEGIAYSMTQWYPKVAAYDQRGWHADPYVAREFYGEFGDHDLRITMDSSYTIAATGVLQNPAEVGHDYAPPGVAISRPAGSKLHWHFKARNVHDIAWSADPDYVHITRQVPGGPLLRFFYQDQPEEIAAWKTLPEMMERSFLFMNEHFGRYPYPEFSFAQGGDGGMEYPMLTLITGKRNPVGVSVHESVHSWFYGVLASNESRFGWMDEGFTEYASSLVMRHLMGGEGDPHADAYKSYFQLAASPAHEPMSIHADHFATNYGYSATAYSKGEIFLRQLEAVIGERTVKKAMLDYFETCKFKHPEPIDLERVMEKAGGMELDWYFNEWINSTRTLDMAVDTVFARGDSVVIVLERRGGMIMPVDVEVAFAKRDATIYHVPLSLMLGAKAGGSENFSFIQAKPWQWTDLLYELVVPGKLKELERVVIDPGGRLADVDRSNNVR